MIDRIIDYTVWTVAGVTLAYFAAHLAAYLIG